MCLRERDLCTRGSLRRCLRYAFSFSSLFIARDEDDGGGVSSMTDGVIVSSESEDSDSASTDGWRERGGVSATNRPVWLRFLVAAARAAAAAAVAFLVVFLVALVALVALEALLALLAAVERVAVITMGGM